MISTTNLISGFDSVEKQWHGPPVGHDDLQQFYGHYLLARLHAQPIDNVVQINHDTDYRMGAGELRARSLKVSEQLTHQLGLKWGDRVCIVADHHDDLTAVVIGMLVHGVVLNPLHTGFSFLEFKHFLGLVQPKAVICEARNVPDIRRALQDLGLRAPIVSFGGNDASEERILCNVADLTRGFDTEPVTNVPPPQGDPREQLALIMCSSGTTGMPKGIRVTHSMCILGLTKLWPATRAETVLNATSLYWISSLVGLSTLQYGAARLFSGQAQLTVNRLVEMLEQHEVSQVFVSAPVIVGLLAMLRNDQQRTGIAPAERLPHLRHIQSTGSMIPARVYFELAELLPAVRLDITYGMSDVGGGVTLTGLMLGARAADSVPGSVGRLYPGTTVRVIDAEGRRCGPDEVGELHVRKVCPFAGYLNNEEANRKAFDGEGFLRTGDVGRIDAEGNTYLIDRLQDFIKYRNFNVSPSELEPFIEDRFGNVVAAVVMVGIPDEEVTFLPAVVVLRRKDRLMGAKSEAELAEEIQQAVKEIFSDAKQLRGGVYFVDDLPRTPSNKIRRNVVREIAVELYNRQQKA